MNTLSFTAIDVKTAAETGLIHQIGIAEWVDSKISREYTITVDPESAEGAGCFGEIAPTIYEFLHDNVVLVYGIASRQAIETAFRDAGQETPNAKWVDCRRIAMSAWTNCGFDIQLADLCGLIGCSCCLEDAMETSRAIGQVFITALRDAGF